MTLPSPTVFWTGVGAGRHRPAYWRFQPDSNGRSRICNPLPSHLAMEPNIPNCEPNAVPAYPQGTGGTSGSQLEAKKKSARRFGSACRAKWPKGFF